jgi:hypothetical protein
VQSSTIVSTGCGQPNGGSVKLSARQSPSSQSIFACRPGKVVASSHVAPDARKLATGARDVGERQMDEAVTAQDGVGEGERIAGNVGEAIVAAAGARCVDQGGDDVDAGIGNPRDRWQPAGIPARRVEQRDDAEALQQTRQRRRQR